MELHILEKRHFPVIDPSSFLNFLFLMFLVFLVMNIFELPTSESESIHLNSVDSETGISIQMIEIVELGKVKK